MANSEQIVGLLPPPPGVMPNFDHPDSIAYRLVIATTVCLVASTAVLLLRLYTKRFIVHTLGTEDYAIIAGQIFGVAFSASTLMFIRYGFGCHAWDVVFTVFNNHLMKWSVIQAVFAGLSLGCVKISILLFYLRLSPEEYFRITVYGLAACIVIYTFVGSFNFLFLCKPIAKSWDLTITDGSCIDVTKIWLFVAVMNIVTDIFILFLPVLMLWHVRMPRRQKIGVIAILMVGVFVCVVSIIRLHILLAFDSGHADPTWDGVSPAIWGTIEINVGVICASLPQAKPFLRRHFPKLLGSSTSGSLTNTNSRRNRTDVLNRSAIGTQNDVSLRVLVTTGKSASVGDTESQRAILVEDGILVRSEINAEEEFNHGGRDAP